MEEDEEVIAHELSEEEKRLWDEYEREAWEAYEKEAWEEYEQYCKQAWKEYKRSQLERENFEKEDK